LLTPDARKTFAGDGGRGSLLVGIENVADVLGRSIVSLELLGMENVAGVSGYSPRRFELPGVENVAGVSGYSQISNERRKSNL